MNSLSLAKVMVRVVAGNAKGRKGSTNGFGITNCCFCHDQQTYLVIMLTLSLYWCQQLTESSDLSFSQIWTPYYMQYANNLSNNE